MGLDPWVLAAPHKITCLKDTFHHLPDLPVRSLKSHSHFGWDTHWIYSIFSPQHAALICALSPPSSDKLDFCNWTPTTNGSFSIRTFCQNSFMPNASHSSSQ